MTYKIIHKSKIIDVVQNPNFLRFLPSGHIAITDKSSAHGVAGSNGKTIYSFVPKLRPDTLVVTIKEISLEEFNRLQSRLNSNEEIYADKTLLARTKVETINNLSGICKDKIISGFSITLSDGNRYTFNLTEEDQLNLLNLENQLRTEEQLFVYHAKGQACKVFARKDMEKIIKAYRTHVLYHTTYFNVAKQYINSLTDVESIKTFYYGANITGMTKDPTLRRILSSGGIV